MTHRRSLLALPLLVLLVLLARIDPTGLLRPVRSTSAAPAPVDEPPFAARWMTYATINRPGDDRSFADPIHNRLYLLHDDYPGIAVFDATTGAPRGSIAFEPQRHAFSADYNRLYLVSLPRGYNDPELAIAVYDTETLAKIKDLTYTCPVVADFCYIARLAEGPDGRLYIGRGGPTLDVLDGDSGALLHSLTFNTASPVPPLAFTVYGDTLYVSTYFDDEQTTGLARYDVSAALPVRAGFAPMDDFVAPRVSPDGQYLTLASFGNAFWQYRREGLALLWERQGYVNGYFAGGRPLVVDWRGSGGTLYALLDAGTGATLRGLMEREDPYHEELRGILPVSAGDIAVFYEDRVDLRRPIDYAAALPLGLNAACFSGPIEDNFRNPASGWPTRSDGPTTFGYGPYGYDFHFADAGQWTAVTRGDVWNNGDLLLATAQVLGDFRLKYGVVGIIYGLNADWTDFYTVELVPTPHRWFNYHFHDGQWELLREGTFAGFGADAPIPISLNRSVYTGEVNLIIDDSVRLPIEDVPGRVGLVAGSLIPDISSRFFYYQFHGDNCVEDGNRAAPLEFAPDLPPHPLLSQLAAEP